MTLFADFNPQVSVPFSRVRQLFEDSALQAGVVGATDFKVAQRGAGANMSVDVPAGQAWVEVTTGTRNGISHVVNDATANVVVAASNATNPRIDQIVLRYNDSSIPTGSGDVPTLAVLTGTATAGATLDNRTGAVALTADTLRLADILVPATSTSVTTANIRDRRPWARGANAEITYTGGTSQTVPGSFGAIPTISAGIQQRVECSGVPVVIELDIRRVSLPATAGTTVALSPVVDGAEPTVISDTPGAGDYMVYTNTAAVLSNSPTKRWRYTPAAGTHLFTIWGSGPTGNQLFASTTYPLRFMVWEDLRPLANNGTA